MTAPRRVRLAVPDLVSNSYFPAVAAVDLGLFAEQGPEAELELIFPVTRAVEALRAGAVDFVAGSAHAPLTAFPDWRGAKLLAALAQRMYWFLVVRSDLHPRRGDISVVKGLRIGAAPGPDLGLRRLLRAAGIEPERDGVRIGPVPQLGEGSVSFGVNAARALKEGLVDGFWANGMGAEVAVRDGVGVVVLDVRRGEGPRGATDYTFPALITTDRLIAAEPALAEGAVAAIVAAQDALRAAPQRATEVGRRRFPPREAELIAEVVRRDLPYYDPSISAASVAALNQFAHDMGLLSRPVPYEQVVWRPLAE